MIVCLIPFLLLIGSSFQANLLPGEVPKNFPSNIVPYFPWFRSNSGLATTPPPKLSLQQEELAIKTAIVEKVSKSRFLKNNQKS